MEQVSKLCPCTMSYLDRDVDNDPTEWQGISVISTWKWFTLVIGNEIYELVLRLMVLIVVKEQPHAFHFEESRLSVQSLTFSHQE